MSTIILLMGVSSSGKSAVAKALIAKLGDDYSIVGFDYAVESLDKKYWPGGANEKEGFYFQECKTEYGTAPELKHGIIGDLFLEKMMSDIINLAMCGENLIIDQVLSDDEHTQLLKMLPDYHFLHIALKPPLEEVIKREKERGDRKIGIAKSMYEDFYKNKKFDIEINTKDTSPSDAANLIFNLLPQSKISNKI